DVPVASRPGRDDELIVLDAGVLRVEPRLLGQLLQCPFMTAGASLLDDVSVLLAWPAGFRQGGVGRHEHHQQDGAMQQACAQCRWPCRRWQNVIVSDGTAHWLVPLVVNPWRKS